MIPRDHRSGADSAARAIMPPVIVAFAIIILLRFPPGHSTFYPQCPIFEYLHVKCPGCGATRAIDALLHGRLGESLHFNAIVALLFPVAAVYAAIWYCRFVQRRPFAWPQISPTATYFACIVAVLFSIVRNLSPHAF